MEKRDIYKEDWIGLKTLDKKKGLVFLEAEGRHVHNVTSFQLADDRCTSRRSFSGRSLESTWDRSITSPTTNYPGSVFRGSV